MASTASARSDRGVESEIMASVDETARATRLVIADIAVEDAWLSVRAEVGADLEAWR